MIFFFFKKDKNPKCPGVSLQEKHRKRKKKLVLLIMVLLYLASGTVYTPETMSFKVSFMANIYAPTDHCLQYALCCIFFFCVLEDGFWKLSLLCWCYEITFPYLLLYTFFYFVILCLCHLLGRYVLCNLQRLFICQLLHDRYLLFICIIFFSLFLLLVLYTRLVFA